MNERILALYRQSMVPHVAMDPSNNMPYDTTIFSADKFASLIIEKFAYGLMDLHGSSPEHIVYAAKLYGVEL
jgi:hypothetical protein